MSVTKTQYIAIRIAFLAVMIESIKYSEILLLIECEIIYQIIKLLFINAY